MGAYEDELEIANQELNDGIITMKEYNRRVKDIESELDDPHYIGGN